MTEEYILRLAVAAPYGALVLADCCCELSGLYTRVGIKTLALPYFESHKILGALVLLALNLLIILWALGDKWRWPPLFAMAVYAAPVAGRLWRVVRRRPKRP